VKALILAGGFATRLRPLSCSKPKLLFPIVGVPLIDRMISWLGEAGIREIILAVNHLSERLKIELGQKRLGSKIQFSVEEETLGTAGPIRLASPYLDPHEPFLALNGDIVTDIDLRALVNVHLARSAIATIALTRVRDPAQYGSVTVTPDGRITGFEEKKDSPTKTNLINAGIYILDPKVQTLIPRHGPVSLERTVFPRLASKRLMWGMTHNGVWYDIGRISDFVKANMEILKTTTHTGIVHSKQYKQTWAAKSPFSVGEGFRPSKGVRIGPNTILSERVSVGEGSSIRNSIIFEDTTIGARCTLNGALVGEKVSIGSQSQIGKRAVVAGEISIPDGSIIRENSFVLS